jgi:hypothetical protein
MKKRKASRSIVECLAAACTLLVMNKIANEEEIIKATKNGTDALFDYLNKLYKENTNENLH